MSDPKRATLITVGAPNNTKNNVTKTVRLTINLDESNESKYPELNYKELVIAEERKKKVENGKTTGLDPFSDNDDDVERVARKFEQKYGGKSTYGRKGRSKRDEFADIGAGYDENDSFIDNTDGYDEMFPPEVDTYFGGFYINSGLLEFKSVPESQTGATDEMTARRNKRRMFSSSSEDESSDSSSESESADEKDPKPIANGEIDSHKTEHRKKKNKKTDKKPKKIRRTDSSAATSGKQTSDDNNHGDGESADSRTSQSDSLASKPAPSSETAITSDSSRDVEGRVEMKLPPGITSVLEELETVVSKHQRDHSSALETATTDPYLVKLERVLSSSEVDNVCRRAAWSRAARTLGASRSKILQRARSLLQTDSNGPTPVILTVLSSANSTASVSIVTTSLTTGTTVTIPTTTTSATNITTAKITTVNTATVNTTTKATATTKTTVAGSNKRKISDEMDNIDVSMLTQEQREKMIDETLERLKQLIEERKPGMMANYDAECKRVQEERKKMIASTSDGAPHVEKRLPKRRFPWCGRSRSLLARLRVLAVDPSAAYNLLIKRALPLFPPGFVRMPTLLRQADLNKDVKSDVKRQRAPPTTQLPIDPPAIQNTPQFTEPIKFPSSLTVSASNPNSERNEIIIGDDKDKYKLNSSTLFGSILNSFSLTEIITEKAEEKRKDAVIIEKSKDLYIPSTNLSSSLTITPVPNQPKPDKKVVSNIMDKQKEGLIRVKSPATLNEMVKKDKEKLKKIEKNSTKDKRTDSVIKDKRIDTPLHIDTTLQSNKRDIVPSPTFNKTEGITQKQIENMRVTENNIPRPGLVPVHHSPTFAKPDKRPPEAKKKKDIVIISDMDPLGDVLQEPLAIDDSSSDVEVIEDGKITDKSEHKVSVRNHGDSDSVPSKDKVIVHGVNHKKDSGKCPKERVMNTKPGESNKKDRGDDPTNIDNNIIDTVMRSLREMEHSQETTKFNSNSYTGVITSE